MTGGRPGSGPCPHCGKPASATKHSDSWGHGYHCCSEECGQAFGATPERHRRDWQAAMERVGMAKEDERAAYRAYSAALNAATRAPEGKKPRPPSKGASR